MMKISKNVENKCTIKAQCSIIITRDTTDCLGVPRRIEVMSMGNVSWNI